MVSLAVVLAVSAACGPRQAPVAVPAPPPQASPAPAAQPSQPGLPPTPPAQPGVATAGASSPATAAPATPRPPAPPPLTGHVTRAALLEYASWKPVWEQVYTPDPAAVASIRANSKDVSVLVIMATWCPDSKREMPRYFATMDAAGLSHEVVTMVGVDRTKKDAEGLTERYGITRVPTFVFLRDGREIGRFVERTPAGSTFEAEIAKILCGQ